MIYEEKLAEDVAEYLVSKGCKKDEAVGEAISSNFLKQRKTNEDKGDGGS